MKQLSIYISILSAIMATSCSKHEVQEQKGIPMSFYAEDSTEKTRALLNTEGVNQNGNVLTVYDLYTTSSNEEILYMDATPVTYTDGNWSYSPLKYWTETGTHSFTAYLSKCGNITLGENNYPTVTYDKDSETLNIADSKSPWEITTENQFDFLYAYHSRSMNEAEPHRPVEFNLNHLLCAVQFNVVNLMPSATIRYQNFTLNGIYQKGSVSITKGLPVINLTKTDSEKSNFSSSASKILEYNVPHNVFSEIGNVGPEGYVLLWPHTQEQFGNNISVLISYYNETASDFVDKTIDLSSAATNNWRAGQRYVYNFYIQDNNISFEVKVVPWIEEDVIIEE